MMDRKCESLYSQVFLDLGDPEFAKNRYKLRRQKLLEEVQHPVIIYGIEHPLHHPHHWVVTDLYVFQDPTLLYLTGINQIQTALLLNPQSKKESEILFLAPKNAQSEFWEGTRLGSVDQDAVENAKNITGIRHIHPISKLKDVIKDVVKKQKSPMIYTFWNQKNNRQNINDTHASFKTKLKRWLTPETPNITIKNIAPIVWPQRLILDDTDIRHLKTAIRITNEAVTQLKTVLPNVSNERQVAARLEYVINEQSSFGRSFQTIAASGKNATTLHYTKNNDTLHKGDLLLIDFGARFQEMHADISRTLPISGNMNPLQRALYDIVRDTQAYVIRQIMPGISINKLNSLAWDYLNHSLAHFLEKNQGTWTKAYDDSPHNIGHLLGRQVHDGDPNRHYRFTPLHAGNCVTVEPGLYGHFTATIDSVRFSEWIGIRIEDNILVTRNGYENLSAAIKK